MEEYTPRSVKVYKLVQLIDSNSNYPKNSSNNLKWKYMLTGLHQYNLYMKCLIYNYLLPYPTTDQMDMMGKECNWFQENKTGKGKTMDKENMSAVQDK